MALAPRLDNPQTRCLAKRTQAVAVRIAGECTMTTAPHSDPQIAQTLEAAWRHLIAAQGDRDWLDPQWEIDLSSAD